MKSGLIEVPGRIIRIKAKGFNFTLRKVLLGRASSESRRHHHYSGCELGRCPTSVAFELAHLQPYFVTEYIAEYKDWSGAPGPCPYRMEPQGLVPLCVLLKQLLLNFWGNLFAGHDAPYTPLRH